MDANIINKLQFTDAPYSNAVENILYEIQVENIYPIDEINFAANDLVIDIGAHVGVFSILLASHHPEVKIIAIEASPTNYENLCNNIEANGITNITPINIAVTGDGRDLQLTEANEDYQELNAGVCDANSGANTAFAPKLAELNPNLRTVTVKSTTLDTLLNQYGECKLMKMDCEGAEHEALKSSQLLLAGKIQNFFAEFHINHYLLEQGHSLQHICDLCNQHIVGRVYCTGCHMSE